MSGSDERLPRLLKEARQKLESERKRRTEPIAIVGIGCRFPGGVSNTDEFWRLLGEGVDATAEVPPDRWDADAVYDPDPRAPGKSYVKRGGFLDDIAGFEPSFFGISPREAAALDPQQRLLLEVSWEALENARIAPDSLRGSRTGVWIGQSLDDYARRSVNSGQLDRIDAYAALGNARSVGAGRIAYVLGLHGPVLQVDTSCSSSLVAVHLACQSLRAGECDVALVGGVNLLSSPETTIALCKLQALSPDGRCKSFDASADGYGRGEGCGILVLKRLGDARTANDPIQAMIRGSAINHDGRSNGLTAPNGTAQEAVIRSALANAGVDAGAVFYVEAHGTGTPLGDPIEVLALNRTYGRERSHRHPLFLGSVKTNFGHLEGAAGVAGLIKAVLCLSHRHIPPHLHFRRPNANIPWHELPIRVASEGVEWSGGSPRIAGLSSFGMSGTNAHLLVEEAPPVEESPRVAVRSFEPVVLSAQRAASLLGAAAKLRVHLTRNPKLPLGDVAHSLATTRALFGKRQVWVVPTVDALARALGDGIRAPVAGGGVNDERRKIAWVFTGQGAQRAGMGKDLYREWPAFRDAMDAAFAALDSHLDRPVRDVMWGESRADAERIHETGYTQPALFAMQWALAALWRSWGVRPDFVIGHSIGEISAACVAEVFDLTEAAKLVAARGRLMQALPRGGVMMAIGATEKEVVAALGPQPKGVGIAAVNGPASVVISGSEDATQAVGSYFAGQGATVKRLTVSHAFHSMLMDPILQPFAAIAESIHYRSPTIPLVSNLSGKVAGAEVTRPAYWVRHAREVVRFADGVATLKAEGCAVFIEMGPRSPLLPMVAECWSGGAPVLLPSGRGDRPETQSVLEALAAFVEHGGEVEWKGVFPGRNARVDLPTYAWDRERYWIPSADPPKAQATAEHPSLGRKISTAAADAVHETTFSPHRPSWASDHKMTDRVVMPAAAWVELCRAAAVIARNDEVSVRNIVFEKPLVIGDGAARRVQIIVTEEGSRIGAHSSRADATDSSWALHARAEISSSPFQRSGRLPIEEIRRRCSDSVDVGAMYESLARLGMRYGPAFRGVKRLWRGQREALGELALPEGSGGEGYAIHPALLDSAFQCIAGALDSMPEKVLIPFAIQGYSARETRLRSALVHLRILDAVGPDAIEAALTLSDDDGEPIARVERLSLRAAPRAWLERQAEDSARPFYRLHWRAAPAVAVGAQPRGRWNVVALGDSRAAETLSQSLSARGVEASVVLLERLSDAARADHWVFVAAPEGEDGDGAAVRFATSGLAAIQGTMKMADAPSVFWVTRKALAVSRADQPRPAASVLWGLGRTAMLERPDLRLTLVDVDDEADLVSVLSTELADAGGERQVAWRGDERRVARLDRASPQPSSVGGVPAFRTDGTVLITGGLGGLGAAVAQYFAGRGVKHLVLAGRRGLAGLGAEKLVASLEALGTRVTVAAVDVANRQALAEVLAAVPAEHPLRGVVHAAGTLDDGLLSEQTKARFEHVMSAKVAGAWNLHALTTGLELDFFLLFSSLAGTLGSAGQSGYAAANAFLDALAAHRQARGLTGASIAWGPWSTSGMAATLPAAGQARLVRLGIGMLSTQDGLRLLDEVLQRPEPELIAAVLGASEIDSGTGEGVPSLLRGLYPRRASEPAEKSAPLDVSTLSEQERAQMLTTLVRAELAKVLNLPNGDAVPLDTPVQALGIDSLMALELRNALMNRTSAVLSATLVFQHRTARAIAAHLGEAILAGEKSSGRGVERPVALGERLNAPDRPRLRLFCFHDAGGSAAMFLPFESLGSAGIEVHAVSHERSSRSAEGQRYLRDAVAYIEGLSDRPYALFGHSLGGFFAWRVLQEIADRGGALPALLALSASAFPDSLGGRFTPEDLADAFRRVVGVGEVSGYLESEFASDVLLWRSLPERKRAPVDVPIAVFVGRDDHIARESELVSWAECTAQTFSLTALPGGHFYVHDDASRRLLLRELEERLASTGSREAMLVQVDA